MEHARRRLLRNNVLYQFVILKFICLFRQADKNISQNFEIILIYNPQMFKLRGQRVDFNKRLPCLSENSPMAKIF